MNNENRTVAGYKIIKSLAELRGDNNSEMDCSEDFDLIFYTDCCPNYIEENEP